MLVLSPAWGAGGGGVVIEAERPLSQYGSTGQDRKAAASGGEVLGRDFGSSAGHFAEYEFEAPRDWPGAHLRVRYARQPAGRGLLDVSLDGKSTGGVAYGPTGGWGDAEGQYRFATLALGKLSAGKHRLRLTVTRPPGDLRDLPAVPPSTLLDLVGNRPDKNSVGHGRNVAVYTGSPSRFFFATHELGNVFSAADGGTIVWYPDHVVVSPQAPALNVNLDRLVIAPGRGEGAPPDPTAAPPAVVERRQVCVTDEDVVVSRIHLANRTDQAVTHRIEVTGDCRRSFDWRNKPGGEKVTRREGDVIVLLDRNVFPEFLPDGLAMAVGGTVAPAEVDAATAGAYRAVYEVEVPASSTKTVTLACAIDRNLARAKEKLAQVLKQEDPVAQNRAALKQFYDNDVPRFECSDAGINEIYAFRWFLLKFSTAGGNLGLFEYPVVMEGRQAFQTYCCYSAPFMAFDMNWAVDPVVGFGHMANMARVAYEDGRFPWYVSPRTNQVPLDHDSKTGLSLLQWTAWRHYQTHGRRDLLARLYPGMAKNARWWVADRDADGNGLFDIDHQLETGMDDLDRRWKGGDKPARYEAVDATVYAHLNLRATALMARELGHADDAKFFAEYADRAAKALNQISWDDATHCWRDRHKTTGELSDYTCITIFYPLLTDAVERKHLTVVRDKLLDENEFWLPYPIPALSRADPEFDPVKRYWAGPSWPAATSHVVEGFATTAKRLDRSLTPQAAELFRRSVRNHLQPRADFYERYNPFTGQPLSRFRDYMHSWWIDTIIRHAAGLTPRDDGGLVIDPLPLGLGHFALRGAPHRGRRIDVLYNDPQAGRGLTVRVDGKVVRRDDAFRPGGAPAVIAASTFR